jgi:hypothetical protein
MSSVTNNQPTTDSAEPTREFFNRYFTESISYPSNQVDAVVGFFENRGFEKVAAASVAAVLLQQAKADGVNVFDLLEGLKSFDKVKLTALVSAILNANRSAISKLGYREENLSQPLEARNILI